MGDAVPERRPSRAMVIAVEFAQAVQRPGEGGGAVVVARTEEDADPDVRRVGRVFGDMPGQQVRDAGDARPVPTLERDWVRAALAEETLLREDLWAATSLMRMLTDL
ncbi:hypothetical protein AB0L06_23320 [Spirillospora sp. NPDC052269]